jgi:adenosylmethionine-8-amino-7-oxononanoate aminotransferase
MAVADAELELLEEGVVLEHVERVEDVKVQPLGEDERVVEQVRQRGLVGEEVVAVGGAQ